MLENPCIRRYFARCKVTKHPVRPTSLAKASYAGQRTISREESNEKRQVNATL